jgi:hypothetical protein
MGITMMEKQIMRNTISFRNDLFRHGNRTKLNRMSAQMFSFSDIAVDQTALLPVMVRADLRTKCHRWLVGITQ